VEDAEARGEVENRRGALDFAKRIAAKLRNEGSLPAFSPPRGHAG
jgi:hypothetical protein